MPARSGCRVDAGRHCSWVSTREEGASGNRSCSATPPAASPATFLRPRPRSARTRSGPHPVPRRWHGSAGMLARARPFGRPCPRDCRNDSSARLWLSPATPSAASQPIEAELVDSSSISAALAASCVRSEPGPLPSTSVTRLQRYYGPIRHLPRPPLALTGLALPLQAPRQTSLVARQISPVRAATTTPAEPQEASLVSCPAATAFPVIVAGRLPRWSFRGLLGVHCALQPARPADSLRSRFLECFSPFVTSWTAPSASGWDEHRRSGFAPEDSTCLGKAHTTMKPSS